VTRGNSASCEGLDIPYAVGVGRTLLLTFGTAPSGGMRGASPQDPSFLYLCVCVFYPIESEAVLTTDGPPIDFKENTAGDHSPK